MANYTAKVTWYADVVKLVRGVKQIDRSIDGLGRRLERHSTKLLATGAALGGAFAGLVKQGIDYGTTVDKIAEVSGVAHEEVSRLAYSTELYHGNSQALLKTLKPLANAMAEARDNSAEYVDEFERAGIEVTDRMTGKLRSLSDVMLDFADYASTASDKTEVLAVASKLLGRGATELLPWLKQGRDALAENFKEAERLGRVLDSETAKALEATGTAVKDMKLALAGLGTDLATTVSPLIVTFSENVKDLLASFQDLTPAAQETAIKLAGIGTAGLLAGGLIGKLAGVLGTTVAGGLGGITLLVGGLVTEFVLLEGAAKNAIEAIDLNKLEEGARKAGMWAGLLAGVKGAMAAIGVNMYGAEGQVGIPANFPPSSMAGGGAAAGGGGGGGGGVIPTSEIEDADPVLRGAAEAIQSVTSEVYSLGDASGDVFPNLFESFGSIIEVGATFQDVMNNISASFGEDLAQNADALAGFMAGSDALWEDFAKKQGKFFATLKKAMAQFLRDTLSMVVKSALGELLAFQIKEVGKAMMEGQLNWGALAAIPGIMAAYGAATAALSGIKSFGTSAVIQQGGILQGEFERGDVIFSPSDMGALKAALAGGGGGGKTVNVTLYLNGSQSGVGQELRATGRWLADMIGERVQRS